MPIRALTFPAVVFLMVVSGCGKGGGGGSGGGQGGGGGGGNTLTLGWNFDGRTCAQEADWAADAGVPGVTKLTVELGGRALRADYDCVNGATGDGVALAGVSDGALPYTVHAWSAQGEELFQGSGSVTVGGPTSTAVTLHALKGGLAVRWHFWNGTDYLACADAGVSSITLNLKSSATLALLYDGGVDFPCPTRWGEGVQLPWLAPGRYFIYLQARDAANARYGTDPIGPPHADVDAGVFPSVEGATQTVELYPQ